MSRIVRIAFCLWAVTSAACSGGSSFSSGTTGTTHGTGGATAIGDNTGGADNSTGGQDSAGGADSGGGAGGNTSAGGSTGYDTMSCADLQTAYATELAVAKTCSTTGVNLCTDTVLNALACGCSVYVNSSRTVAITDLGKIRTAWNNKQCATTVCPAIACTVATAASCVATSGTATTGTCTAAAATTN